MKPVARRIACVVAASLVVLPLAACGDEETSGTTPREAVTVILDWTPNTNHAGVYLARQKGYYRDAGLDVKVIEPDQAGAVAQVMAGNGQFAFSYAEQVLPARAQGTDVVSIAAVTRTNTSSLASPADRGIRRPRDLEGKTYAGFGGEIEKPLIDALVRCDGGDPAKVRFVDVGNVDYTVGFRRKAFDAVWVFDGWDVIRMRRIQKTPVNTIRFRDHLNCIPDWYTPVIATSGSVLKSRPATVRAFLAATAKGYEDAAKHPSEAAAAVKQASPEADQALLVPSARFMAPFFLDAKGRWGEQDPGMWEGFNAFLRTNDITSPASAEGAFTNDFLPKG